MDEFSAQLNYLLVETFRSILKVEAQMLKSHITLDLSINEMHLIETVGKADESGLTISSIAEELSIAPSSATVAVNKLQKKGYIEKTRCGVDNRVVYVKLTRNGKRVDAVHRRFHETMVKSIAAGLSEEEKNALTKGVAKLNAFFNEKLK